MILHYLSLLIKYHFVWNFLHDNLAFVKNVYDLRQDDVKSVIKGAEATFVPMIVRHLQDQPYTPEDLYFIYQGLLCSYINPPKLNHETIVP